VPQDNETRRAAMVADQIAARGVRDERVLEAMRTVPREAFVPPEQAAYAFDDRALSVAFGQTISQPYVVAFMTESLGVGPSNRVLEIGTGTGYQTAILSRLAACVFTVERLEPLSESARDRLTSLGYTNPRFHIGDGTLGWPEEAPFDRIIVTAAAPRVGPTLLAQLAEGGRLVVPVGEANGQRLTTIDKSAGRLIERPSIGVRFVPLIGQEGFAE
jgi:protein-L-isoaspartate(D-aspartate) O-methyltransferase